MADLDAQGEWAGNPSVVDVVARVCHEANRVWCQSHGDFSQEIWEEAEEWQRTSARSGVRSLLQDPEAGPEASHRAWMQEKLEDGWRWGAEKDPEAKLHPCLVPYAQLPIAQRRKDHLFVAIVRALTAPMEPPRDVVAEAMAEVKAARRSKTEGPA